MGEQQSELTILGRITSAFGVKGWVKVYSFTEPMDGIFDYKTWTLMLNGQPRQVRLKQGRRQSKGLVAQLEGVDTREAAQSLSGAEVTVATEQLPALDDGEYYWHQLEGLSVLTREGDHLGRVHHLMATGANDVLVVRGNHESLDRKERLIPYLPDQVIDEIDLDAGTIKVDWDPDF